VAAAAGEQLLHRVNDLLDLARLEAGQLPLRPRPVAAEPFLRRIFLAYDSQAVAQDLTLALDAGALRDRTLVLDADKVEKIMQNLLTNALKFTPTGGQIQCHAGWQDGRLWITLEDDGPGVPPEWSERIFDRYFRAPGQAVAGAGIGLALSRELAERMGGQLELVDGQLPGACFRLLLPAEEAAAAAPARASVEEGSLPAAPKLGSSRSEQVLVVEDQIDMADYLEHLLRDRYQVLRAANGQEALRQLQTQAVDLILSDVMMPGMDGLAFREKIRDHERWRDLPFIFLTARSLEDHRLEGLRLGVDDYLLKPFRPAELLTRIDNLLARRQRRRSAADPNEGLSAGAAWWQSAHQLAVARLSDPAFNVKAWAEALGCSTRHLARQADRQAGVTPVVYLLELRLQRAYHYLSKRQFFTVAEAGYAVGIESASYLSRKFKERFGVNPRDLLAG
jgi:CheY-like chemotaxis protein